MHCLTLFRATTSVPTARRRLLFATESDGRRNSDSDIDNSFDEKWDNYSNYKQNTNLNNKKMKKEKIIRYTTAGFSEEDSSYNVKNIPLRFDTMATNYASVGINYTVTFLIEKYGESPINSTNNLISIFFTM